MEDAEDLRTRRFNLAVEQAASAAVREETASRLRQATDALLASRASVALLVATLAALLLLVLRPPFVLRFEQDQRRPWKGSARMAWPCLVAASALTAALAALLTP